jgi:signal peptidase I
MSWREKLRRSRARREAKALVRHVRSVLRRPGYRVPKDVVPEIAAAADRLDRAVQAGDHDAICIGLAQVDEQAERHLFFARKSAIREYADSIGVALLVALFLRTFVVEAFKIPSGSMIPTMEVGDHIFVNKFLYGLRVPFIPDRKFLEWRKPKAGEVIVFVYPKDETKDFIKRVVAVEGDQVEVHNDVARRSRARRREVRVPRPPGSRPVHRPARARLRPRGQPVEQPRLALLGQRPPREHQGEGDGHLVVDGRARRGPLQADRPRGRLTPPSAFE